jgi:stage V sporulation protein SpoVS
MVGTKLTTAGIIRLATDLYSAGSGIWKYVDWGTGTTDPVIGDTALQTPATETRVTATITNPSAAVYRAVGSITCNATGKTISEAGLFNASTGVTLLIRGTFTGIPVVQNDVIQFTFDLTYTTS